MLLASLIALSTIAFGQVTGGAPAEVPLCEIVAHPENFNGKMVRIRGLVLIDFEQFELSAEGCDGRLVNSIWLEYGKGPKSQPTIRCCGNLTPRDSIRLDQNKDFSEFHRLMTARKRASTAVTTTFTGRVDFDRNGGFGHLGLSTTRLVIQSVSNVIAKPR